MISKYNPQTNKIKSWSCWIAAFALLFSCGQTERPPPKEPAAPIKLDAAVEFTVKQRSTVPLPGSSEKVVITIEDITRGQVITELSRQEGATIVAARSLRENDVITFTIDNHTYHIQLTKLTNLLVGNDRAVFRLWPAEMETDQFVSEREKIEALIQSLRQLDGAIFIRNGQEHTLDKAIAHLTSKWDWQADEIKTAGDFIRMAGSKSSVTGEPYSIRLRDGTELKTEAWFKKQLESMKKPTEDRDD